MRVTDAKKRAFKKNLDFNIDVEYLIKKLIETNYMCPYLGVKFEKRNSDYVLSIDRIDPTKGYVKGNIEITSRLANTMKNKATNSQLMIFAENILKIKKEDNYYNNKIPEFLTTKQVAKDYPKYSINSLVHFRNTKRPQFPYYKIGRKILYKREDIEYVLFKQNDK
tara:strand:+ start:265 stop:762 length:498 start_codon:yes stop_codon:yes gene_type:complete